MSFNSTALLVAIPPALGLLVSYQALVRRNRGKRLPFSSRIQRPPGESCREKIDQLNDKLLDQFLWLALPMAVGIILSVSSAMPSGAYWFLAVGSSFVTIVVSWRLWKTGTLLQNYRLGFAGERVVAQELNQMLALGWKVYHDVQFDGFNIDHVVVGTCGVFAIETKARRKALSKDSHRVAYDGKSLVYPGGRHDSEALTQALRNAATLGAWLSGVVGDPVWVTPVVTLPGWWVDRTALAPVLVVNPKEISSLVTNWNGSKLTPDAIRRIAFHLDQKNLLPE